MKNIFYWGLDVSTTNIGFTLMDSTGKLVELKHLALKVDKNVDPELRDLIKADMFKEYITNYKNHVENELNGEVKFIMVEEPLGGSNNANTVSLLFGFNGIVRYILKDVFNIYPRKISVHDERAIFMPEYVRKDRKAGEIVEILSFPKGWDNMKKKHAIWEKVSKMEPNIDWFYKKDGNLKDSSFDMSDSFCCLFAGLIKFGIFTYDDFKTIYPILK